jgi:hypothetical protein
MAGDDGGSPGRAVGPRRPQDLDVLEAGRLRERGDGTGASLELLRRERLPRDSWDRNQSGKVLQRVLEAAIHSRLEALGEIGLDGGEF